MAVKQLPKISDLPEPPDRLVGDQERFDVLTFNSLKAQKKMVNEDLNKALIPALNQFAVDVNASVDAAKASETSALASKNSADSSAATATTKAGEAAASAKAAKTSETSALASKNAASSSATAAANAQKAAEAARDEAQDLANVGYASESHAGLAKVDGKTTQADAGGTITVKDVAIGGNLGDLASARGQVGDYVSGGSFDFNNEILDTKNIFFGNSDSTNRPFAEGPFSLQVKSRGYSVYKWISYFLQSCGYTAIPRAAIKSSYTTDGGVTYATAGWSKLLDEKHVGDGLRVNNGIISVPEYEGATASTAGTSGLVPPAAAGQQESFLTGGGEYKPALTKISDSVSLADSTTAASAKAVKTAYELANGKQANLGFTPVQQGGGSGQDNSKIYIGHGTNGLKAQIGTTDLGCIVTTVSGTTRAPSATNVYVDGFGEMGWVNVEYQSTPLYVWCLPAGSRSAHLCEPSKLSVGTSNICISVPNTYISNVSANLPNGGTWRVIVSKDGNGVVAQLAGGSYVEASGGVFMAIRVA